MATGEGVALGPHFDEALAYAGEVHRRDVRKGSSIPSVSHLLAACSLTRCPSAIAGAVG